MTSFSPTPKLSGRFLMLTVGIFFLASTEAGFAKNGGNSGDHGEMRSHDSSRNNGDHEGMRRHEPNRDRDDSGRKYSEKHEDKHKDDGKHAEQMKDKDKEKEKTSGTTTATTTQPVAGPGNNNTIHPIPGTPAPVTVSGPGGSNTIHPIPSPPPGTVTITNGVTTYQIPNGAGGVSVSSNSPGTITVTNGTETRTLNGGSLTVSGAIGVGGSKDVEVGPRNGEGSTVVAIKPPPTPPVYQGEDLRAFSRGTVLDGIADFGYGRTHGFAPGPAPPPTTSTTTQQ